MIRRFLVAAVAAALFAAGCGADTGEGESSGGLPADIPADQTVDVALVDLDFRPETLAVKAGTTVKFVFRNEGQLPHQALFGDEAMQEAYGKDKGPKVGVTEVGPGQTATFVIRFDKAGPTIIGCHIPGHYQAGMKAQLNVE